MPKKKVEVYEKDQLIYPFIESDHVSFSNGMKVSEMLDQSISMPTVIHEDLSFKVGVGNQDVSSAIVDSSVAEMTIKGKTYQNILPEPSTHVLTNNKEMFKVNEGLDPNVEIVDGVSKSAILSGSTKYRDISSNKIYDSYETATNVWSENKYKLWSAQDGGTTSERNGTITSGTDIVTLDFHAINHSAYKLTGNCTYKKVVFYDSNQTFISSTRTAATTDDLVVNNIPSNARYVRFAFFPYADNTGSCSIVDENNNPINLRQIQLISCKMPVLTTIGNNVFDEDNSMELGAWGTSANPVEVSNEIRCKNPFTPFPKGLKNGDKMYIVLSDTSINSNTNMHVYDENKTYLSSSNRGCTVSEFVNGVAVVSINDIAKCSYFSFRAVSSNINCEFALMINDCVPYEPYKTNILMVNEPIELHGIDDIKDTLDLATGELIQRIDKVVLDGGEDKVLKKGFWDKENTVAFYLTFDETATQSGRLKFLCSELKFNNNFYDVDEECILYTANVNGTVEMYIRLLRSRLENVSVEGLKSYLSKNPIIVFRQRIKPVIKTVDLSSSGNWDKVVLNGNETWSVHSNWSSGEFLAVQTQVANKLGGGLAFTDSTQFKGMSWKDSSVNSQPSKECVRYDSSGAVLYVFIKKSRLTGETVNDFKEWLQENPITVWYQTATRQDSTQVKQPIFFKDGHIQLSSRADNSLIPTLNYQAKTSNSYVMDLMKTNTKYTMKAKTASGTFTIDGTSYGAGTNGTFTTPSSMTNKLLVMSNKTNTEVMILEGDVVSKTIPYFKGIKSAFEDEDKIEALSAGKNLFDGAFEKGMIDVNGVLGYVPTAIRTVNYINVKPNTSYHINLLNLEPFESFRVIYVHEYDENFKVLGETEVGNRNTYTSKSATKFIKINTHTEHDLPVDSKMIVCENSTLDKQYEPYKSNSTKIPLLSPLRSLPNGVYDELIIDRENNKAKIVQRVGVGVLDGTQNINMVNSSVDTSLYQPFFCGDVFGNMATVSRNEVVVRCDKLLANSESPSYEELTFNAIYQYIDSSARLAGQITKKDLGVKSVKDWFRANPTTIYYQLATPVVTEVDLEGFPYIYKDGHIFLNSEITPTTEIIYSINQSQQISASNEDIIRHEKELTYLQKLIAQYVQVDYESALLSLKV